MNHRAHFKKFGPLLTRRKVRPKADQERFGFFLFLTLTLTLIPVVSSLADPLTPIERQGKHLYLKTTSPSGREIKAFIGIASTEAPGEAMPCVNCHGQDGRGRPSSGIFPSNIIWQELTKSYGIRHSDGREHPAYTGETIRRAITKGIDPAGNRLNPAMPLYSMPEEDLEALIAYLKRLGTDLDPGLSETQIRIGTLFPSEGPFKEMGEAIKKVLQALFSDANERGGIYHRQLELVTEGYSGREGLGKKQTLDFLQRQDLFALISPFTPGLDRELPSLVEAEGIPLIGPYTIFPTGYLSLNQYTFYILSGLSEQARALVDFAATSLKIENPRMAIVYSRNEDFKESIEATEGECKARGWNRVFKREYSLKPFLGKELTKSLRAEGMEVLLFFGDEAEANALLGEIKEENWSPVILLFGVLTGKGVYAIPDRLKHRVYLAYPALPEDRKEAEMRKLMAVAQKYHLPSAYLAAQLSAYSAVQILFEGLMRSGREVSREKLLLNLERLFEFNTGLTPLITYGPNKHIGAMGAYIVTVDPDKKETKDFISSKKWVALN